MLHPPGSTPADAGRELASCPDQKLGDRHRRDDRQITLFDSVGFAIEDFSALAYVHDRILGTDFKTPLDLIADPDDPRDLFGMLLRAKRPPATMTETASAT